MFSFVRAVHITTVDKCHILAFRLEICFELEVANRCIVLYNTLLGSEPHLNHNPPVDDPRFGALGLWILFFFFLLINAANPANLF